MATKKRWVARPMDDSSVMRRGDTYILLTRLTTDPERIVEVILGDSDEAMSTGSTITEFVHNHGD